MPITYFETDLEELDKSVTNGIRMALGLSGFVAALVGVLILAWPAKTAAVVAAIIAIYAAVAGLVNLAIGVFSRRSAPGRASATCCWDLSSPSPLLSNPPVGRRALHPDAQPRMSSSRRAPLLAITQR